MNLTYLLSCIIPLSIAPLWHFAPEAQFVRHSINTVFEVQKNNGAYMLRLSDAEKRAHKHLHEELAFVDFLAQQGLPVACPLKSDRGNFVERITHADGVYYATLFYKLVGRQIVPADITLELARKWGTFFGRLHQLGKQYCALHKAVRYHWHEHEEIKNALQYIPHDDLVMRKEYDVLMAWLHALPRDANCYGLIHSDAWDGNFLLDANNNLLSFDYDDCQHHWFVYDLAVCLTGLQQIMLEHELSVSFDDFKKELIAAHHELFPLERVWYDRIDMFMRLRHLYVYSWVYKYVLTPHQGLSVPAAEEQMYKKFVLWWRNCITYIR